MSRRVTWIVFVAGLAVSALLTVLLWPYGVFLFFLLPFLFRFPRRGAPSHRTCPRCGRMETDPAARFCPRDATPLEPA